MEDQTTKPSSLMDDTTSQEEGTSIQPWGAFLQQFIQPRGRPKLEEIVKSRQYEEGEEGKNKIRECKESGNSER